MEAYDDACEIWERADHAWLTVEFTIARDPEAGRALNEAGTLWAYTFQGAGSAKLPTLTVIYRFDAQTVDVIKAQFLKPKAHLVGRA